MRKLQEISDCEHAGDWLRRSLNEPLYTKTLIPESRGDVMELLENMHSLLDRFKGTFWRFKIKRSCRSCSNISGIAPKMRPGISTRKIFINVSGAF